MVLAILDIIYSYLNNQDKSIDFWINTIKIWFNNQSLCDKLGKNFIKHIYKRNLIKTYKNIEAWKFVFLKGIPLKKSTIWFYFSYRFRKVLKLAIDYRNKSIQSWIDSIK